MVKYVCAVSVVVTRSTPARVHHAGTQEHTFHSCACGVLTCGMLVRFRIALGRLSRCLVCLQLFLAAVRLDVATFSKSTTAR